MSLSSIKRLSDPVAASWVFATPLVGLVFSCTAGGCFEAAFNAAFLTTLAALGDTWMLEDKSEAAGGAVFGAVVGATVGLALSFGRGLLLGRL